MLPVLLDLKFIKIYTFGVFLVLSFFWAAFLLWKNFLLTSHKEEDVFDSVFLSLFGGLFIARLIYVALHFSDFGFSIFKFILINGYPGLSLYGFLLGFVLTLYFYFAAKKVNFLEVIDYFVPSFFLALAFGKLGSFFSGTEVGITTKFFLAVRYVGFEGLRHMTAFYEGLFFFIATFISYKILYATRRGTYPKAFNFYFFLWFSSLVFFLSSAIKVDNTLILGLRLNWIVSLVLLLTFSFYFLYYFRNLILEKVSKIRSLTKRRHAKKTKQIGHQKIQSKTGRGEKHSSLSDRGAEKE